MRMRIGSLKTQWSGDGSSPKHQPNQQCQIIPAKPFSGCRKKGSLKRINGFQVALGVEVSQCTACQQAVGARGKHFRLPNHRARV